MSVFFSRQQPIAPMLVAVACLGLTSCAQQPERPGIEPPSSTVEREKLALDLEKKSELAEALVQWKVLATIDPDNKYYKNRAADLSQTVDKKSKALVSEGVLHLRRGAREAARSFFLRALALNPRNKEAFDYLRKLSM